MESILRIENITTNYSETFNNQLNKELQKSNSFYRIVKFLRPREIIDENLICNIRMITLIQIKK